MLSNALTETNLERMKVYCEKRSVRKEQFISASGHTFWGYLVTAHDVKMSNATLRTESDILITEFDEDSYGTPDGALESDEVIAFMDSLSDDV